MIDMEHDGHEWTPRKRQALGQIRAGLESARRFIDGLEGAPAGVARARRSGIAGKKLAAVAVATALEVLARRAQTRRSPRRRMPGFFKLAVLSAAVMAAGKLIAAKR